MVASFGLMTCRSVLNIDTTKTGACALGCRVCRAFALHGSYVRTIQCVSAAKMSRSRAIKQDPLLRKPPTNERTIEVF